MPPPCLSRTQCLPKKLQYWETRDSLRVTLTGLLLRLAKIQASFQLGTKWTKRVRIEANNEFSSPKRGLCRRRAVHVIGGAPSDRCPDPSSTSIFRPLIGCEAISWTISSRARKTPLEAASCRCLTEKEWTKIKSIATMFTNIFLISNSLLDRKCPVVHACWLRLKRFSRDILRLYWFTVTEFSICSEIRFTGPIELYWITVLGKKQFDHMSSAGGGVGGSSQNKMTDLTSLHLLDLRRPPS